MTWGDKNLQALTSPWAWRDCAVSVTWLYRERDHYREHERNRYRYREPGRYRERYRDDDHDHDRERDRYRESQRYHNPYRYFKFYIFPFVNVQDRHNMTDI